MSAHRDPAEKTGVVAETSEIKGAEVAIFDNFYLSPLFVKKSVSSGLRLLLMCSLCPQSCKAVASNLTVDTCNFEVMKNYFSLNPTSSADPTGTREMSKDAPSKAPQNGTNLVVGRHFSFRVIWQKLFLHFYKNTCFCVFCT